MKCRRSTTWSLSPSAFCALHDRKNLEIRTLPFPISRSLYRPMNTSHLLFSTVLILLLAACSAAQDQAPAPTAVPASPAEVLAPATAPPATSVPVAFVEPTAAAVPRVTSEPTAVPTIVPAPEIDPYALAREILEQSEFAAAEGWLVTPCEGEAAVLAVKGRGRSVRRACRSPRLR